jgi:hypothetical protein
MTRPLCHGCHTRDLISIGRQGRFMPLHADTCPVVHESDLAEIRTAIAADVEVWRNGQTPTEHKKHMAELRERLAREHEQTLAAAAQPIEPEPEPVLA